MEQNLVVHFDDGPVRFTPDGKISVLDAIQALTQLDCPKHLWENLKKHHPEILGELPVQGHIDLHGLTKQDAETAVTDFLLQSFRNGLRCVLIVHGRGLNSPESHPVLKEGLPQWLNRGRVRKVVLAFATARPYDGGTGATYVFLRNR